MCTTLQIFIYWQRWVSREEAKQIVDNSKSNTALSYEYPAHIDISMGFELRHKLYPYATEGV